MIKASNKKVVVKVGTLIAVVSAAALSGVFVFGLIQITPAYALTTLNPPGGIWNSAGNVGVGTTGPRMWYNFLL
ncbi:MAG: hypothetical protein HY978_00915 [Candidatus Liptonbacteria bacterium]|nr:hypothetical protein [Candidatus Liptonbacteria bacterium]